MTVAFSPSDKVAPESLHIFQQEFKETMDSCFKKNEKREGGGRGRERFYTKHAPIRRFSLSSSHS